MNPILKYSCPKCGNKQYEIGEIWTVGSFWTRIIEVHNRKFTYLSCQKCKYTELYKVRQKDISGLINFPAK